MNIPRLISLCIAGTALSLSACVTYLTPGPAAPVGTLSRPASGVAQTPQAVFPIRLALARIQASGYRSYDAQGLGNGAYSVVVQREVEKSEDYDGLRVWPQVLGVVPISQLALPEALRTFDDLRQAARNVQADVLFVYTFDTHFGIENTSYRQQRDLTLGVLPGREAQVASTASGMFVDVDTGFIYGLAEGSSRERTPMSKWTKPSAADETRLKAEREAFEAMMAEARRNWDNIVLRYGEAGVGSGDGDTVQPNLAPALRQLQSDPPTPTPPTSNPSTVQPPAAPGTPAATTPQAGNLLIFGNTQPAAPAATAPATTNSSSGTGTTNTSSTSKSTHP